MSEELKKLYEERKVLRRKIQAEEDKIFMKKVARMKAELKPPSDEPRCHSKVVNELSCHSIQCH